MLIECVPNFSEGRDETLIARLVAASTSVPGAVLLDRHSDPDHHRTVLTIAGRPSAVCEAVFRCARVATDAIDLRRHQGVHPRIGATDVVPIVPLRGLSLADCVPLANALGERLAAELGLPIYYYAAAARRPERARLPWLREPEFEGLAAALASAERAPDVGPHAPHPSAGATVVGARGLLLAFNVDLATRDVTVARRIARALRASSGGLPGLQAKGLELLQQGRVQVSMNLVDLELTGPGRVLSELERLAAAEGVAVGPAELVGLMPRAALRDAGEARLALGVPLGDRVLEDRLASAGLFDPSGPLEPSLDAIARTDASAPGGGSAAAMSLALGVACLRKALGLSDPRRASGQPGKHASRGALGAAECDALLERLPTDRDLLELAADDHAAFASYMAAIRMDRADPARARAFAAARAQAVLVPKRLLELAIRVAEVAARVAACGNPNLVNDAGAAAELAVAAGRVARWNARTNQPKDAREDLGEPIARLEAAVTAARISVDR